MPAHYNVCNKGGPSRSQDVSTRGAVGTATIDLDYPPPRCLNMSQMRPSVILAYRTSRTSPGGAQAYAGLGLCNLPVNRFESLPSISAHNTRCKSKARRQRDSHDAPDATAPSQNSAWTSAGYRALAKLRLQLGPGATAFEIQPHIEGRTVQEVQLALRTGAYRKQLASLRELQEQGLSENSAMGGNLEESLQHRSRDSSGCSGATVEYQGSPVRQAAIPQPPAMTLQPLPSGDSMRFTGTAIPDHRLGVDAPVVALQPVPLWEPLHWGWRCWGAPGFSQKDIPNSRGVDEVELIWGTSESMPVRTPLDQSVDPQTVETAEFATAATEQDGIDSPCITGTTSTTDADAPACTESPPHLPALGSGSRGGGTDRRPPRCRT